MSLQKQYPMLYHPCFSDNRENLWARIHLPVAKKCNVKCIFCDHSNGSSCHTSKPGYSSTLMTPEKAFKRTLMEIEENPNLKIIAISGPGEPLFNIETFTLLEMFKASDIKSKFCISTNGVLLGKKASKLRDLEIESISVSVNAISQQNAARMYEWAMIDGAILKGTEMAKQLVQRQLEGIELATKLGITVKVNTVLIPPINALEIETISREVSLAGAVIHNIVPLVPCGSVSHLNPPTSDEILEARRIGSKYIAQFSHCRQCRSDVVGIPGDDRIL